MNVSEIFYSIDGEGKRAGFPAVFVRLSGCNLNCGYCDTKYACDEYTEMSIQDIVLEVKKYNCQNITLTGGEPLLQEKTIELLESFKNNNMQVIVETNGSLNIGKAQKFASICMDWKIALQEQMLESNLSKLRQEDILKIIVQHGDLQSVSRFLEKYKLNCDIYLSPVFGKMNLPILAEFIKNYRGENNLRLQLQLHKFIWSPEAKGV